MVQDPADKIIEEFFNSLKIEHQYYSVLLNQPVFLIGEKSLYKAVKLAIEKTNNINNSNNKKSFTYKTSGNNKFKPLPSLKDSLP